LKKYFCRLAEWSSGAAQKTKDENESLFVGEILCGFNLNHGIGRVQRRRRWQ
jgi:hypothetical protein